MAMQILKNALLPSVYLWGASLVKSSASINYEQLTKGAGELLNNFNPTQLLHEASAHLESLSFADPVQTLNERRFEVALVSLMGVSATVTDAVIRKIPKLNRANPTFRVAVSLLVGIATGVGVEYLINPEAAHLTTLTEIAVKVGGVALGVKATTAVGIISLKAVRLSSDAVAWTITKTCDIGIATLEGCNLIRSPSNNVPQAPPPPTSPVPVVSSSQPRSPEKPPVPPQPLVSASGVSNSPAKPPEKPAVPSQPLVAMRTAPSSPVKTATPSPIKPKKQLPDTE